MEIWAPDDWQWAGKGAKSAGECACQEGCKRWKSVKVISKSEDLIGRFKAMGAFAGDSVCSTFTVESTVWSAGDF